VHQQKLTHDDTVNFSLESTTREFNSILLSDNILFELCYFLTNFWSSVHKRSWCKIYWLNLHLHL